MKNNYNERSWAIDVITEINLIVSQRRKTIRRAGGERTLKASTKSSSLFPDVLLFQDEQSLKILQGWELKMPDTPITDAELLANAAKKANLLGLNSYLVWNVSEAALYVNENGNFVIKKHWADLIDIKSREEVEVHRDRWGNMLGQIIDDLEDFFNRGEIKSQNIAESLSENNIIDVITGNIGLVKQNIQRAIQTDAMLEARIEDWWEAIKIEYSSEPNAIAAVSKLALVTWVNRFLFTHYLKKFTNKALEVDQFDESTTVATAKQYFDELTAENNFLNVYSPVIGEEYIDDVSWEQILQLNLFLSELQLQDIDQRLLQQFFERLLLVSRRKTAGQYATPYPLADYLTRVVMLDRTKNISDPFCGTGTILRAAFDLKIEAGISATDTINTIWGSDKFSFPLQMSTLSLAKPEVMGKVIHIFKSDIKDLQTGLAYNFIDPNNGQTVTKTLPQFDYIISNLPFVGSANISKSNPDIYNIIPRVQAHLNEPGFTIPNKSDIIAYLPYYLWELLSNNGRIGLIISNSWLGTAWGEDFRVTLNRFFKITQVITSINGKWFDNAEVVTNLVILEKRNIPVQAPADNEDTSFVLMAASIQELADKANVMLAARQTLLKRNGLVLVRTITKSIMDSLAAKGLGWSAYFANLSWFPNIQNKLIKANTLFAIERGERRGWDRMFYPSGNHGIEPDFIKPVLKNLRNVTGLIADADGDAFCCSETIEDLTNDNKNGALAWIRRFKNGVNGTGKPLTESLKRARHHWYEMKATTVADLIGTINYGNTLVIAKMRTRSFVNQRLIRFTVKNSRTDVDLCHALMNSYIGIFYIEALGFGRGQGALDLSSTKLKDNYCMLDPSLLNNVQIQSIKAAFLPLTQREIDIVPIEVNLADRRAFEQVVADAYQLTNEWDSIKDSLIDLYTIRNSI
jgi:hypothetical protein